MPSKRLTLSGLFPLRGPHRDWEGQECAVCQAPKGTCVAGKNCATLIELGSPAGVAPEVYCMARKLKIYRTSAGGFFELAVAAPSMKAAAEAWGADKDVFERGFAEQTDDPKVVEAAMAMPGVVLRRPVGSHGEFSEHAPLPKAPKNDRKRPSYTAERVGSEK